MVQKSGKDKLRVKVLDFGLAKNIWDNEGLNSRGFKADIAEVLRLFSGLYTGIEFNSAWDLQHNWERELKQASYGWL